MNKSLTTAFVFGTAFLLFSNVSAAQIENLDVTPAGAQVLIEWDKLSDIEMYDEDGYALQWSVNQSDIRNDKPYKLEDKQNLNTRTIRAAEFDREETYYFRVYSYRKDGRQGILNNGSKILKWKWLTNGDVESEFIAANDPVISTNDSSSNSVYSFGNLSAIEYDTSIQFNWSNANLADSEYDGYSLVISQKQDLSNPIVDVEIGSAINKAFIEGLTPNTKYYAAGYFYKNSKKFGKSPTIEMSTLVAFTDAKKARFDKYVIAKGNLGFRHKVTEGTASTADTSTATTASTTTTTQKVTDTTNEVAVKARIAELKKLIKLYETELATLEKKVTSFKVSSTKSNSTSSNTPRRSVSSRINSIAERLRARLNSK